MAQPDVKCDPEAINTIVKYNLLKQMGSGYTFKSLDDETFENIQLMNMCMTYESNAMENAQKLAQFREPDR